MLRKIGNMKCYMKHPFFYHSRYSRASHIIVTTIALVLAPGSIGAPLGTIKNAWQQSKSTVVIHEPAQIMKWYTKGVLGVHLPHLLTHLWCDFIFCMFVLSSGMDKLMARKRGIWRLCRIISFNSFPLYYFFAWQYTIRSEADNRLRLSKNQGTFWAHYWTVCEKGRCYKEH